MRRVHISRYTERAYRVSGHAAAHVARRICRKILLDGWTRASTDGVLRDGARHLRRFVIQEKQESRGRRKIVVRIKHVQANRMRQPVAEHASKGCQIDAATHKDQRLNARNGPPEKWHDAPGLDPRVHRCDSWGPT